MTDMEKKVMVRLCAKILTETDLYDTDKEVQNLIDWVLVSEQMKENRKALSGGRYSSFSSSRSSFLC